MLETFLYCILSKNEATPFRGNTQVQLCFSIVPFSLYCRQKYKSLFSVKCLKVCHVYENVLLRNRMNKKEIPLLAAASFYNKDIGGWTQNHSLFLKFLQKQTLRFWSSSVPSGKEARKSHLMSISLVAFCALELFIWAAQWCSC